MIMIGGFFMFCRSCGNQIADNAKFCNMCGAHVTPNNDASAPSSVIPDPAPAPAAPQPEQRYDTGASNDFFQKEQPVYKPYEPAYHEPVSQPYAPSKSADAGSTGGMGKFIGPAAVLFLFAAFLISSPFLHMFGDSKYSFGAFSYLNDLAKIADKNIFSLTIDAISNGSGTVILLFVSLWSNILFEFCALIFLIIALIGLASNKKNKAVKVLGNIRVSISLSLIGLLICIGTMIAYYLNYGKFSGLFKEVFYIFAYVFLGVAIVSMVLACIFVGKAKREYAVSSSYQQPTPPSYQQPTPPQYQQQSAPSYQQQTPQYQQQTPSSYQQQTPSSYQQPFDF